MKTAPLILALLVGCGANMARATPWGTTVAMLKAPELPSRALGALAARGGDGILGSGITKDVFAVLFIAEAAMVGTLAVPDPVATCKNYGMDPAVEEGSLEAWTIRTAGYSKLNSAIFTFLTVFKDMSPELAIAYSVIPCSSAMVSGVLNGELEKHGTRKGIGEATALLFLGCQYAIFSGSKYSTLGAQILAGLHLVQGGLGCLMPTTTANLMGIDVEEKNRSIFWKLPFSAPILNIGIAYATMLSGASAMTALSYRALSDAAFHLIGIFSNDNEKVGFPRKASYPLVALSSIIALGASSLLGNGSDD